MIGRIRLALWAYLSIFFLVARAVQAQCSQVIGNGDVIEIVSAGENGSGSGSYAAISADGRYVAFETASAITPGAISGSWDVYVHDRDTDQTERQSTRSDGAAVFNPGDYTSPPSISANGAHVAFLSRAENLVNSDGNRLPDIFLHNSTTGVTSLVSVSTGGNAGNDASFTPVISADGRFVAFQSFASDLVEGDRNQSMDVFIRDMREGLTEIISVTSGGEQGGDAHDYGFPGLSVSADGRFVAFAYDYLPVQSSQGSGGPNIYLRDRQEKTTRWVSRGTLPALSGDARFIAFVSDEALAPEDTDSYQDVYLLDLQTNRAELVSVTSSGAAGGDAEATFIQSPPSVSGDGRYTAFESTTSLAPADDNAHADIYLRDRNSRTTTLLSLSINGSAGNGESHFPALSANAAAIAFTSLATDLIPGDTNGQNDVFIYQRVPAGVQAGGVRYYIPIVLSSP